MVATVIQYTPAPAPIRQEDIPQYLRGELEKIARAFSGVENIQLVELNVAPDKPRNGMIVLADGTNFNPGSGAGMYGRIAGAWVKLG